MILDDFIQSLKNIRKYTGGEAEVKIVTDAGSEYDPKVDYTVHKMNFLGRELRDGKVILKMGK